MLVLTQFSYPYDKPLKTDSVDETASSAGDEVITTSVLLKRFNIVSVLGCIVCSMYCYSGKEPIMSPMLEYYYGIDSATIANMAMIEGYAFILGSVMTSCIPQKYKNFNKMCLLGVLLYFMGMLVGGPVTFIEIERVDGAHYFIASVALTGLGQSFIMPSSIPAMEEATRGVWVDAQQAQAYNSMSALATAANGTGNFVGCILGALLATLAKPKECLSRPSALAAAA